MGEFFSEAEARALLNRRFTATAGYSNVPPGTVGQVVGYERHGDGFDVEVCWPHRRRDHDFFSKGDLETVFEGGPYAGQRAMVPVDSPDVVITRVRPHKAYIDVFEVTYKGSTPYTYKVDPEAIARQIEAAVRNEAANKVAAKLAKALQACVPWVRAHVSMTSADPFEGTVADRIALDAAEEVLKEAGFEVP